MNDFKNPAKEFLRNHKVESLDDVIAYCEFLRTEAGVSSHPPVDLQKILDHFGLRTPHFVDLPNQQGTTIPVPDNLQIIIHAGDKSTRQRFSIAHELVEILFIEMPGELNPDRSKTNIFGRDKELMCQSAAANLLMPSASFIPRAKKLGLTLRSAEILADEFDVSLLASLCRIIEVFNDKGLLILWTMKNKPSEIKNRIPEVQMPLFEIHTNLIPDKKLRISWVKGGFKDAFAPLNKSAPTDSSIYTAWNEDSYSSGEEHFPFGKRILKVFIESKPITIDGEKCILSLLQ